MGADGGILLRWMHIRAGKKPPRPGHINLGRAGLVIQNLLRPTLKTEQYKECLPPQIRMGVSYQWRFQNRSFLLLTEVLPQNGPKFPWVSLDDKSEYSGGCEFQQRMSGGRLAFALRAGFRYPANEITLGAGILFDGESGKGARITDIDASHRVKRVDADGSNWYPEDLLMQVSAGLGPSDSAQYWNAFRADSSAGSETAARRHLLRILERYPELDISKAAERLFCHFDKKHREWYLRVMSDLHDPEFLPPAARPAENSLR